MQFTRVSLSTNRTVFLLRARLNDVDLKLEMHLTSFILIRVTVAKIRIGLVFRECWMQSGRTKSSVWSVTNWIDAVDLFWILHN